MAARVRGPRLPAYVGIGEVAEHGHRPAPRRSHDHERVTAVGQYDFVGPRVATQVVAQEVAPFLRALAEGLAAGPVELLAREKGRRAEEHRQHGAQGEKGSGVPNEPRAVHLRQSPRAQAHGLGQRVSEAQGARRLDVEPEVEERDCVGEADAPPRRPLADETVQGQDGRHREPGEKETFREALLPPKQDERYSRGGDRRGERHVAHEVGKEALGIEEAPEPVVAGGIHDLQVIDPRDRDQEGEGHEQGES